jgi:hypothetical protein
MASEGRKRVRNVHKERTTYGFMPSRTPVFSPLTHPHISSRERRLVAIFNKLTMLYHNFVIDKESWFQ